VSTAAHDRLLARRYRLEAIIGSGGMGTVWRAHDLVLTRDVAVKEIIWPPFASEAEHETARRRASQEAQMAARLWHPNVVGIYDIVEEDDRPWIVMELLPYRSLRDIVLQDGPLPPARAAELGLGVLAALRAAHREGVLHRDVKPGNILAGSDGRVVLTDFGIARAADSPTLTTSGLLIGSPSYIAPERALGGHGGPASDLWGLGASLYTAVEGRPPFEREGALPSLTAVVADEPDPAVNAGPLWPLIGGLLAKDPGLRIGPDQAEWMLRQVAAASAGPRQHAAPATERLPRQHAAPAPERLPRQHGTRATARLPRHHGAPAPEHLAGWRWCLRALAPLLGLRPRSLGESAPRPPR
jgi:serine/threonine protein kinase